MDYSELACPQRSMGRVTQTTLAGPAAVALLSSPSSPFSLQAWFRQELEKLGFGIDAGFYTHHTLDILRQTDLDLKEYFPSDKQGREERRCGRPRLITEDELEIQRKEVAVIVLKNNTESEEEKIQKLVDEVAQKVKAANLKEANKEVKRRDTKNIGNKNPEERYRAEFPALSEKCDELRPRAPVCASQWANIAKHTKLLTMTNSTMQDTEGLENSPNNTNPEQEMQVNENKENSPECIAKTAAVEEDACEVEYGSASDNSKIWQDYLKSSHEFKRRNSGFGSSLGLAMQLTDRTYPAPTSKLPPSLQSHDSKDASPIPHAQGPYPFGSTGPLLEGPWGSLSKESHLGLNNLWPCEQGAIDEKNKKDGTFWEFNSSGDEFVNPQKSSPNDSFVRNNFATGTENSNSVISNENPKNSHDAKEASVGDKKILVPQGWDPSTTYFGHPFLLGSPWGRPTEESLGLENLWPGEQEEKDEQSKKEGTFWEFNSSGDEFLNPQTSSPNQLLIRSFAAAENSNSVNAEEDQREKVPSVGQYDLFPDRDRVVPEQSNSSAGEELFPTAKIESKPLLTCLNDVENFDSLDNVPENDEEAETKRRNCMSAIAGPLEVCIPEDDCSNGSELTPGVTSPEILGIMGDTSPWPRKQDKWWSKEKNQQERRQVQRKEVFGELQQQSNAPRNLDQLTAREWPMASASKQTFIGLPHEHSAFSHRFVRKRSLPYSKSDPMLSAHQPLVPRVSQTSIIKLNGRDLTAGSFSTANRFSPIGVPSEHLHSSSPTTPQNSPAEAQRVTEYATRIHVEQLNQLLAKSVEERTHVAPGYQPYKGKETKNAKFVPVFPKINPDKCVQTSDEPEDIGDRIARELSNMMNLEEDEEAGQSWITNGANESNDFNISFHEWSTGSGEDNDWSMTMVSAAAQAEETLGDSEGSFSTTPCTSPFQSAPLTPPASTDEEGAEGSGAQNYKSAKPWKELLGEMPLLDVPGGKGSCKPRKYWKDLHNEYSLLTGCGDEHTVKLLQQKELDFLQDLCPDESGEEVVPLHPKQPEGNGVMMCSDLEKEMVESSSNFSVQKPQKSPKYYHLRPGEKLCPAYARDGECFSEKCPFGHDKSRITCKFWEKSGCFKELTCPFLHGYPQRREEKIGFIIEDGDFPELSRSNKLAKTRGDQQQKHKPSKHRKRVGRKKKRDSPQIIADTSPKANGEKKSSRRSSHVRRSQHADIKRSKPK